MRREARSKEATNYSPRSRGSTIELHLKTLVHMLESTVFIWLFEAPAQVPHCPVLCAGLHWGTCLWVAAARKAVAQPREVALATWPYYAPLSHPLCPLDQGPAW